MRALSSPIVPAVALALLPGLFALTVAFWGTDWSLHPDMVGSVDGSWKAWGEGLGLAVGLVGILALIAYAVAFWVYLALGLFLGGLIWLAWLPIKDFDPLAAWLWSMGVFVTLLFFAGVAFLYSFP